MIATSGLQRINVDEMDCFVRKNVWNVKKVYYLVNEIYCFIKKMCGNVKKVYYLVNEMCWTLERRFLW